MSTAALAYREELDQAFVGQGSLEDQERALREITELVAAKMADSYKARAEVDRLYARWCVVKENVVELRRRAGRIDCKLSDGSRIYDLEAVIT